MSDALPPRLAASRTALGVAALRAAHQLIDDAPRVLDDPLATRLVDAETLDYVRAHPEAFRTPPALALRAHVLLRSRYAEDRLALAVARGVRQYVIIGAGLDTSAYRAAVHGDALRVFEVDHPASQAAKRARLAAAGIAEAPNVTWVSANLERDDLAAALAARGFDDRAPAFVTCLGVLVYLDDGAAAAVLRFAASLPPSEFVFTFAPPPNPDDPPSPTAAAARDAGEPWRWFVLADVLALRLHELGFVDVEFVSGDELSARYLHDRRDGLRVRRAARLVRAAT